MPPNARRFAALAAALLGLAAARPAAAQNPSFNLLNRGAAPIVELFVTPAGDARWGQNRLRTPIAPGASFAVRRRIDGNCIFDLRVVFADHRTLDRRGLNTCDTDDLAVGGVGVVPGGDFALHLLNQAKQPVDAIFATPSGLPNWGRNRLDGPIDAGATRVLSIGREPNTCLYDLKVVFADHTAHERHRTDLCHVGELPIR